MNWQDALEQIESPGLDAELNLASGTSAFFRRVGKQNLIQETLRLMEGSGEAREAALDRICDLAMAETNPNYQNPHDTPLAVLLWLTYFTDEDCAHIAANYVDRAPRCWYAKRLAQHIVNPTPTESTDSWNHLDSQGQVSFRSSSPAETLNLVSPVANVRVAIVPPTLSGEGTTVGAGRQAFHWNTHLGVDDRDGPPRWLGFLDTDGGSNLRAAGWVSRRNSASAPGVEP